MAVVLLGYTGMMILFKVCIPFTWQRVLLFGAVGTAFVLAFLFLGQLFSLEWITFRMVGLLLPLGAAATAPVSYTHLDVYKRQLFGGGI